MSDTPPMRRCTTLAVAALSLSACTAVTQDLGKGGASPGIYVCGGRATISAVGAAVIYSANGALTFDCGSGAFFGQGYPASNLPTMPNTASPQISGFPPLGRPPTTTP